MFLIVYSKYSDNNVIIYVLYICTYLYIFIYIHMFFMESESHLNFVRPGC